MMQFVRRLTEDERISATMESLSFVGNDAFHQVMDGRLVTEDILNTKIQNLHAGIFNCPFVYAACDEDKIGLPIASFVVNKPMGLATLQHLLSRDRINRPPRLGRRAGGWIYAYCMSLLWDIDDISSVFVPLRLHSLPPNAKLISIYTDEGTHVSHNKNSRMDLRIFSPDLPETP